MTWEKAKHKTGFDECRMSLATDMMPKLEQCKQDYIKDRASKTSAYKGSYLTGKSPIKKLPKRAIMTWLKPKLD